MQAPDADRAVAAATAIATSLGIPAERAIVLHDSNKLTLRLTLGDVVARVAPPTHQAAEFELRLARRLVESGCPVAGPDPRVEPRAYERDGFTVTLWTYEEPSTSAEPAPADYAEALRRLHDGMRTVGGADLAVPHFTDRVDAALELVASRERTPALAEADRQLLGDTLRSLGRAIDDRGGHQLLHGEPHPGNLVTTAHGVLFVDLETCCRGPVEFDLAHAPDAVAEHYPGTDDDLLRDCRILVLAMITTWRWDRDDQLPDGRRLGVEWLDRLRTLARGR